MVLCPTIVGGWQMTITHYEIVDRQTKHVVGTAKTLASATRSVDRRDNAYGAYRYFARPVRTEGEAK